MSSFQPPREPTGETSSRPSVESVESVLPGRLSSADDESEQEMPEFGLVDVIEAFTAMRHEWRGQTRESRALAESVESSAVGFQRLQQTLAEQVAALSPDDGQSLVNVIMDVDSQLARAVEVLMATEADRFERVASDRKAVEDCFSGMNWVARRLARPLMALIVGRQSGSEVGAAGPGSAVEGLGLLLSRLQRMMKEQQIERLDVVGQQFDPELMKAIGRVASAGCPAGEVVEQLSPGYRWQGRLLRFADVRVAQ